jgi:hypothetical protein
MAMVEVRECAKCKHVVIYWGGRFQHLTDACPEPSTIAENPWHWRNDA